MKKPRKQNQPQSDTTTVAKSAATATPSAAAPRQPVVVKEVGHEPTVGRTSMPVLLIALLGALVYWGNMFIVQHGGELDARVQGPYVNWKQIEALKPQDESARLIAQGARVYGQYCSSCHMPDGNGNASSGFPPLTGSDWVLVKDPSRIIRIVLNGLAGPITVNGKQYGQVQMLPWRDSLKDEEIAAVLTYVRNTWGNKAPAVDAALVKQIRDETKGQSGPWTAADLLKISLKE
jgi:mono/diheme cytochrome c family protein